MSIWMVMAQVASGSAVLDLSNGPVTTTTVAVTVTLDAQGRVILCRGGSAGGASSAALCRGFPKGRIVSAPLRRNGRPVAGLMSVSTTTIVSQR
jgi:hypothetical protein